MNARQEVLSAQHGPAGAPHEQRGPRTPLVAGIAPGVGTSTLAAALHALDGGVLGQQADVVVCAPAEDSLRAAAAVACPGRGPRPVLVVTGGPVVGPLPAAIRTRFSAVVELPRVASWVGRGVPTGAASDALATAPGLLPPPVRPYAEALRAVVAALLGAGVLDGSAPPMVIRPRAADPWRGPHRPAPIHPVRPGGPGGAGRGSERPSADGRTAPARPRHRLPDSAPCGPQRPAGPPTRVAAVRPPVGAGSEPVTAPARRSSAAPRTEYMPAGPGVEPEPTPPPAEPAGAPTTPAKSADPAVTAPEMTGRQVPGSATRPAGAAAEAEQQTGGRHRSDRVDATAEAGVRQVTGGGGSAEVAGPPHRPGRAGSPAGAPEPVVREEDDEAIEAHNLAADTGTGTAGSARAGSAPGAG